MTARTLGSLFSLALLVALPASAQADGQVASATGAKQVNGQTVYVDVVVAVPRGQTRTPGNGRALAEQGARREKPPWAGGPGGGGGGGGGEEFFYTGLEWSPPEVHAELQPARRAALRREASPDGHAVDMERRLRASTSSTAETRAVARRSFSSARARRSWTASTTSDGRR